MAHTMSAQQAVNGNIPGMALLGGGVMSVAMGLGSAFQAATNALREVRYSQSLGDAMHHANDMAAIASAAIEYTAQLEAEVAALRAACTQRQEVIDILKARMP